MDKKRFQKIQGGRGRVFETAERPYIESRIQSVSRTIEKLAREADEVHARFLVVIIPDQLQIDPEIRAEVLRKPPDAYDFDWPTKRLIASLAKDNVQSMDLLPGFRSFPKKPRLYRKSDTHFSAVGNALAADLIASFLASHPGWPQNKST